MKILLLCISLALAGCGPNAIAAMTGAMRGMSNQSAPQQRSLADEYRMHLLKRQREPLHCTSTQTSLDPRMGSTVETYCY